MNQVASDSLLWIKSELDAVLTRARQALEAYVEDREDRNILGQCLEHLHQIQGTLRIVEVYGAAMLAEEMEAVAAGVYRGDIEAADEAFEVLMRAILQLPDYLERVINGRRDMPLALLSLLNDLRSVRGQPLLTESALFAHSLEDRAVQLPTLPSVGAPKRVDLGELARRVRPKFQAEMLSWFKNDKASEPLKRLAGLIEQLEQAASRPPVFELWWIVGGVLEALSDGGIEASVALKQMLGQVDRQIKRLTQESEGEFAAAPPRELINNLLYYVGRASSTGERVEGIKKSFNLGELLPGEEHINDTRAALSGPNANLMRTVSAAIKEDLSQVKDSLDIFVRTGRRNTDDLIPLAELLKKVADTLAVLGLGALRSELVGQTGALKAISSGERGADETALLDVAQSLLRLEVRLDDDMAELISESSGGVEHGIRDARGEREDDSEYRDTFTAVIRESIVNLARVKEAITEYTRGEQNAEAMARVPEHMRQVQAGVNLLGMDRPANVLDSIRRYVEQHILNSATAPSTESLDRMADALVSVEFYLETVQSGRGDPQSMLDNAEACLEALGVSPERPAVPLTLVETATNAGRPVDVEDETAAVVETPATSATDEAVATEPEPPAPLAPPAPMEPPAPVNAAPPAAAKPALPSADDVDPEILEIFLEEAHEEIARLQDYFPRWHRNADDREALAVVRRSFHTLKGSGRMVGAGRIGEFAWAVENMLNRIIDGTVAAGDAVLELVAAAVAALPELLEELEAGRPPEVDVDVMVRRAEALSRGEEPEYPALLPAADAPAAVPTLDIGSEPAEAADDAARAPELTVAGADDAGDVRIELELEVADEPLDLRPQPAETETQVDDLPVASVTMVAPVAPAPASPAPVTADAAPDVAPAMDPALYEIFSKEVAVHLDVIEAFLDAREQGAAGRIDESLLRAFHTLNGSAHTADARPVCALVEPAERYLQLCAAHHELLPVAALQPLRDMLVAVRQLVPDFASPGGAQSDFSGLVEQLAALAAHPDSVQPEMAATDGDIEAPVERLTEPASERMAETPAPVEPVVTADDAAAQDDALVIEMPDDAPAGPVENTGGGVPTGDAPAEVTHRPTDPADEPPAVDSDFDPELAAIFAEEARELLEAIDVAMQGWSENRRDETFVAELQRHLHTFKGGARMAGIMPLGDLSHELETLLTRVVDGRLQVSDRLLAAVQRVVDRLHQMLEQSVAAGRSPPAADDLLRELAHLQHREREADADDELAPVVAGPEAAPALEPDEPEVAPAHLPAEEDRRVGSRIQTELMRVRADLLESALNHAGEVGIYRSRLEQQISSMNFNLAELDQTVARVREQLRKFEIETEAQIVFQHEQEAGDDRSDFDPLELDRYSQLQQLSRSLMESVGDLVSIQGLLSNQARESETLLLQQSRVTTELQDGLMRTRMVPFSSHAQRLRRVVRQAAQETRKNAELKLSGAEGEMDRQVLERVLAPLEHMLRNAVVHGIEAPDVRQAQGKSQMGQITIGLHREGAEVVIDLIDDGAGLNIEAIRAQAETRGLAAAGAQLSENDIMQFIFEPGFSTAKEVTLSAGRGVGMDVVASELKQLGGTVSIDSVAGAGTKFTIRLPFTLAISQALMVTAGEEVFAIPLPAIEGITRLSGRDLARYFQGELQEFMYGGREYRLQHLSGLLGLGTPEVDEAHASYPVLLVRSGDYLGALIAESMQGSREVVVKSIGPQIASIRGISGATILGDGSILLILDPGALLRTPQGRPAALRPVEKRVPEADVQTLVMVVDDSITVRRVTQRLLERYGMRVETAKDGVDALTRLQDLIPDIMLLDIEMPRMDGYELATNVRNDERLRDVPIIMITSRTGDKHRSRAMEIGVNEYLGKPYQETELLECIQRLTGRGSAVRAASRN